MALLKTITLNGRRYGLHYFTGTVVDEKKWSETEVSGSGGGGEGYTIGGTGYTAPTYTDIRSTTTRHDQIILQNSEGKEQSFSFQNWNLACRKGNIMSVLWAIPEGQQKGPYVLVYNHDSDTRELHEDEWAKIFQPGRFTLPLLGWNVSWWPLAAIPGTPIAWELLWIILPLNIGAFVDLGLFASPFVGAYITHKLTRSNGEKIAVNYLQRDPDGVMSALRESRQEATTTQAVA